MFVAIALPTMQPGCIQACNLSVAIPPPLSMPWYTPPWSMAYSSRALVKVQVKNNANPEFDEVMTFIVDDPDTQTITAFLREADFAFSKAR